jgi:hypothetical protein
VAAFTAGRAGCDGKPVFSHPPGEKIFARPKAFDTGYPLNATKPCWDLPFVGYLLRRRLYSL